MLSGKTLQVVPQRLIIRSWRGKDRDLDSTLIISFLPDKEGGRIEPVHVNVRSMITKT